MEQVKKKVFQHFVGMDEFRERKKAEVARIRAESEKYTPAYINNFVKQTKEELMADRKERAERAKQEIEQFKKELTVKQYKNPYMDIKAHVIQPEDKLVVEMQLARKLEVLKAELAVADTPEELEALYEQYGEYEHFSRIIRLEAKKRVKGDGGEMFRMLEIKINQPPKEVQELNKLYQSIHSLGNMETYPKGLEGLENGDFKKIKYETLI